MRSGFASSTTVNSDGSVAEIKRTLQRFGASSFVHGETEKGAMIEFQARERRIRFVLHLPDRENDQFTTTPTGRQRKNQNQVFLAWEQGCRAHWRALALIIKAKLVAVESGIRSFEEEFLADTILPGNRTVSGMLLPQVAAAYESGKVPKLTLLALPYEAKEEDHGQ
ncbi:MAG: hypothetical protein WC505_08030 [Patescibacteria group bacterium]